MTKTDASAKRDEFMRTVNGSDEPEVGGIRPVLLREFIDQKYLPFQRGKWKKSTQGTSENRIMHHVVKGLGDTALKDFSLTSLQAFLESKADEGLSFSVVDHLRWDLSAILEMAVAEKVIASNPGDSPLHAKACAEGNHARHVGGRGERRAGSCRIAGAASAAHG